MGASLCCLSKQQNRKSRDLCDFRSGSTADSWEYAVSETTQLNGLSVYSSCKLCRRGHSNIHNTEKHYFEHRQSKRIQKSASPRIPSYYVSTHSSVCAFVGLAPIKEESPSSPHRTNTRTLSCDSSVSDEVASKPRFLNYGSMKNYQRFVKTH